MSYIVTAPLVLVRDGTGRHVHAYKGTVINKVLPEQRDYLLRVGFIEEIADARVMEMADAKQRREERVQQLEDDRVRQCAALLDQLDVPRDKGRIAVRALLELRGHRVANETLAAAIKTRKELSQTEGMPAAPRIAEGQN
jgi:hypothetical protein